MTLEDAVRAALLTNPDVGIVSENRRATEAELRQARAGFLPSVDIRGAAGPEFTNDPGRRSKSRTTKDDRSGWMPRYESGISLRQMLYDGEATSLEVERQEARTISASRRVRESSELVALDAIEAYLDALRQRELTAIAEENVLTHQRTLALVETREQGGAATIADVQQAAARLATAEDNLTDAQARLRDADATYVRVVGESPENLIRPIAPVGTLPGSLNETIELALQNNPTIAVSRADVEAARKEYLATKSPFLPRFDLELDANSNRNVDGERGQDTSASALLVLRYNLFAGGRDINRRQEFISRLAESRQRLNRAVRLVEEQSRLSWNALISARQRVAALQREVDANELVTITYRQQYDLGGRDILDLLDADRDLFLSRSSLTTVQFVEFFSIYRILADGGVLLSALNVAGLAGAGNDRDPVAPLTVEDVETAPAAAPAEAPVLQVPETPDPTFLPAPVEDGAGDVLDDAALPPRPEAKPLVPASGPEPPAPTRPIAPLEIRVGTGDVLFDPIEADAQVPPPGDIDDVAAVRAEGPVPAARSGPVPGTDESETPLQLGPAPLLLPPAAGEGVEPPDQAYPDFSDPVLEAIEGSALQD